MNTITIKLHAYLNRYSKSGDRTEELNIQDGATVGWLMDYYGFMKGEIGIAVMNGVPASLDDVIADSAAVEFFPLFAGG